MDIADFNNYAPIPFIFHCVDFQFDLDGNTIAYETYSSLAVYMGQSVADVCFIYGSAAYNTDA
jgi:hypothetical protein